MVGSYLPLIHLSSHCSVKRAITARQDMAWKALSHSKLGETHRSTAAGELSRMRVMF